MYDTLRPDLITATTAQRAAMRADPTAVVQRDMFFSNAFPYLEVRRPFILGTRNAKWRATLAHRFAEQLHLRTGKLTRLYTQNIDGLDFQLTEIPSEKIVPVHGSIGRAACESCGHAVDFGQFCDAVQSHIKDIYGTDPQAPMASSPVVCDKCGRPTVKPTTVLYGASLPEAFFHCADADMPSVDLLIVAGTSLVVPPANSLVYRASASALRLVVNNEEVGAELGIDYSPASARDCFACGECDDVFLALMAELGWLGGVDSDALPEASRQRLAAHLAGGIEAE